MSVTRDGKSHGDTEKDFPGIPTTHQFWRNRDDYSVDVDLEKELNDLPSEAGRVQFGQQQQVPNGGPVAQYHDEEAWLAKRREHLTGTDIAAIFGLHPYRTAGDVQDDKLGRTDRLDDSPILARGRDLEPIAVRLYEQDTGRRTRKHPFRVWKDNPLFGCSVDRQVFATDDSPTAPLEAKVFGWQSFSKLRKGLPDYVIFQGQIEAAVHGAPHTVFTILHPDSYRRLHFEVPIDEGFIDTIRERAGLWWDTHVLNRDPVEDAVAPEHIPEVKGEIIVRTDAPFIESANDLLEARDVRKAADELYATAKAAFVELVGEKGIYEATDARIHYQERAGRVTFDKKALAASLPLDPLKVQAFLNGLGGTFRFIRLPDQLGALMDEFREASEDLRLDLSQFEKRGKSFPDIRPYRLKSAAD